MGYDAFGMYTPDDTEYDPGAGVNGPLGSTAKRDLQNIKEVLTNPNNLRVAGDQILDTPVTAVRTAKLATDAWAAAQQYLAQRVPVLSDPAKRRSFSDNYSDQSRFGDGAKYAREDAAKAAEAYAHENPNATPEAIREVGEKRLIENESTVNKATEAYSRATDRITGAPAEEDRTAGENIIGTALSALVPGGQIAALERAGKVGRLANKVLEKTKIPGADLIDPRTTNYTTGGVALNAGVGAAATTGLEIAQAPATPELKVHVAEEKPQEGVTTYANDFDAHGAPVTIVDAGPSDESPHAPAAVTSLGIAGLQTAAIPFLAALGIRYHKGAPAGMKINPLSTNAGPGHVEAPQVGASHAAYAFDEQAPLEADLARSRDGDKALGRQLGTDNTLHVRTNVGVKVEQAHTTGQLDNVQKAIPSISAIDKQIMADEAKYGPQFSVELNKGMAYRTEYADRMRRVDAIDHEVQNYDMMISAKQKVALNNMGTAKPAAQQKAFEEITKLQQKRAERATELQKLQQDLPEDRLGLVGESTESLKKTVDAFEADPRMKQYMDMNEDMNRGVLDYYYKNGVLSKEDYRYFQSNTAQTHVLMKNDPYLGKDGKPLTGWTRAGAIARARLKAFTDDLNTMDKNARAPGRSALMSREPAEKLSDRVNNPINWRDAKHAEIEHAVRFVERETFKRNHVNAVMLGPKWHDVLDIKQGPGGNPLWSANAIAKVTEGGKTDVINFQRDTIINHGGMYQVVRMKDERSANTLMQPPQLRVPIATELKNIFGTNTTGNLNPFFALKRVWYDAAAFSINRGPENIHGLAGGYQQLRRGAEAATGFTLPESPQWLNLGARFAGPVGHASDMGAIYGVSFMSTLESFFRSSQHQIGKALTQDLANRSPVFAAIAKISPQFMDNLGQAMLTSYKESLFATAANLRIVHPREYAMLGKDLRDYDKMLGRGFKKLANNPITAPFIEMANVYSTAMRSFEQSVMYSAFTSMASREMMKHGVKHYDQLPAATRKSIERYARTTGGDFARVPGQNYTGRAVQIANAMIPYNNVMQRAIQSVWRAGKDHPLTLGASIMTGIVAPRVMNEWMLSNWDDEAHKTWFEATPHWERVQYMPSISAAGLLAYYKGEPFKPEYLTKTLLVPEMRTPGIVVSEGLRALGAYGKRSFGSNINDPNLVSVLDRTAQGLKDGLGVMAPPWMQVIAAAAGTKIDPGNIFNNIPAFADMMINGDAAQTRVGIVDPTQSNMNNRQGAMTQYNPTSELSKNFVGITQALLGGTANMALEIMDTYGQRREADDGIATAAMKALDAGRVERQENAKKQVTQMTGNTFFKANEKVYIGTPAEAYVRDARSTFTLVSGKNAVFKKSEPIDDGGLIDQMVAALRFDGVKNLELKGMTKEYFELNAESKKVAANRQLKPDERAALEKDVNGRLAELRHRQAATLQEIEKTYLEFYGDEFKQRFGKPMSFATMRAVITKAGNATRYRPDTN